jgi:hypothetical protein
MFRNAFKPGNEVAKDGAYWVHHYQHRVSHLVSLHRGDVFPRCAKCEERVRFEAHLNGAAAPHISNDPDFSGICDEASKA